MNKLLKSGFILTFGNLFVQGLSFITLPIYTRIIEREVLGQFNLYMSWISIISIFIGMQLSGSLGIGKIKYKNFDEYVVNTLTLSNFVFLMMFLIVYIFKLHLKNFVDFNEKYILIMFLNAYFSYLIGFIYTYFIQLQETFKVFLISLITAVSSIIISLFLVYKLEDDFNALVIGKIVPLFIFSFFVIGYFYKKKNIKYKKEYFIFALGISIPLIFHNLAHNILNQFDRIMIGKMLGLKEVAFYSFGYNVGMVIQLVFSSMNSVWCPHFFKLKKENSNELNYHISRYFSLAVFLTLGYLTVYPELSIILGGEKYVETINFIPFIVVSYFFVFLYSFPVNIQFYNENTKYIPFGTLFAGLLNVILNYILIPKYNIYGAVIATVISYMVLLIIHHIISRKLYDYKEVKLFTYFKLSSLVFTYAIVMRYFSYSLIIRWSFGILVVLIYFNIYKNDIFDLIRIYKKNT